MDVRVYFNTKFLITEAKIKKEIKFYPDLVL